ncbi:MAG: zinc-binding alcohol dehydrogenase family protein [Chloroflexi bacterium]|nr:zinc-binding alcohol dehydrogenase family protein [Chloroflexota bacterium]
MAETGASMRAVIMERVGKARVLKPTRLPRPQPAPAEALVKVQATSVNPADLLLRSGRLIIRKPLPHILGSDLAGEIVELGDDVDGWDIGDRVFATFEQLGCEIDGGYAEYCALPADKLIKLPDDLDFQSAVASGASFAAALLALVTQGKLKKADTIVIRGAAGGVGASAVQIAAARGAKVIAICEGAFVANLHEIGADIVLEDAGGDLVRQVQVATGENGASLVLHCNAKLDLEESVDMLCAGGRLVIACPLSKDSARLNAMDLYQRNLSLHGAYGSVKPKDFAPVLTGLARGKYRALIDEVMPLSGARKAHRKLEKTPAFGKIILVPDSVLEAAKKPDNWIPID